MFSKFDTNPQSDELTAADLYDAQGEWEAEQYEWTEEAIAWEEGMRSDNLYDDEDFDDIGDNELYENEYGYEAWEEYCGHE